MNRKSIIFTVFGILFFFNGAFGADKYVIDPAHTSMGFAIRHLVINKVKGDFKDYTATFNLDERDISGSSASAVIQVASIDTGVEQRDNDLRSPNFFDVKKYPTITFQSKRFEKRGEKEYVVIGTLTMHGVSKEIHMPFTIVGKVKDPWGKTRIGIESEFTLNRLDYGIGWNKKTADGGLVVGHTVDIEMNFEMIKVEN
jgi:polyisoprenoid-binding protein YceI